MFSLPTIGVSLLALCSFTSATTIPKPKPRQRDVSCVNTPATRNCWTPGYSVQTNFYDKFPDTGKTRTYNLEVTETTLSPDGIPRKMMVFNGQYPGPPIVADWGDTVKITVKNSLALNGTDVHWHGMRQLNSCHMDGVNGITECPIAPGDTKTYTWKAVNYGTSWYHSHFSVQYADGLVGPIIINGPTSSNYDIDLGALSLTDWFHEPVFEILASRPAAPPTSQTILVNGTGTYNGGGQLGTTTLTPGKKHLLRLVNNGINNYIHVSLDGHPFTVVANDLVPVKPFVTTSLSLAVGQRYDVIVEANQPVANYYFRVGTGGGKCDGPNEKNIANDTKGYIFNYAGAPSGAPTSTPFTLSTGCADETNLVPIVPLTVPAPPSAPTKLDLTLDTSAGVFWKVNGVAMQIDWKTPTFKYIQNGTYTLPAKDNGIVINGGPDTWAYWLIQNDTPLPHPIHLHGHDFFVVAEGDGNGANAPLNLNNPIRRDTHTARDNGYLIIAFPADNPGAWLMHCHIPFHISGGLGVQFLERPSEVLGLLGNLGDFESGCSSWNAYANAKVVVQDDSGL